MICGRPASAKSFKKWVAGAPQATNHLGNDFRHARKCQTFREVTFAKRGNTKPFGKWLSLCAETSNHSGSDFRQARKHQTFCGGICGRPIRDINKKSVHLIAQMNALIKKEAATYSPALHCSTIGARGLNFSVRNGKRWDPTAITTWCIFFSWQVLSWRVDKLFVLFCLRVWSWQVDKLFVFLSILLFVLLSLLF